MKRHEQVFKRTLKHKKQHKSMKKLSYVMQKQAKAYKTLQSMHMNEKVFNDMQKNLITQKFK